MSQKAASPDARGFILYHDARLIVVDKPPGMLVHRSALAAQVDRVAMQAARDAVGRQVYPVHRLDRPTSGALMMALDPDAARAMSEQFERGEVVKTYVAVVRGHTESSGVVDHPLAEARDPTTDSRARAAKPPQSALTLYRRLAVSEIGVPVGRYASARHSLLAVVPRTGRRHQIRRHLKHASHPVVGDTTHGDGRHNALFRDRFGCDRLLLHALALEFLSPFSGARVVVEAPPEAQFARVCEAMGWAQALADARRPTQT